MADNTLMFTIDGPGEIVVTDNGNPTDLTSFASHQRAAFNGIGAGNCSFLPRKEGGGKGKSEVRRVEG